MNYQPDFNLKGISSLRELNQAAVDRHSFPYSGMWLFSGQQGAGKTLLLMECVRGILAEYPEVMIVSNISLFGIPSFPYTGIEDFEKYHNGDKGIIFIIDEIHTLFSSLESARMPVSTLTVWSQNRKNRRLILGTTQRFSRAAKGLREQCSWHYECRRALFHLFYCYRVIDASLYDDQGKLDLSGDHEAKWRFYVPHRSTMLMYNTLEVVKRESDSE